MEVTTNTAKEVDCNEFDMDFDEVPQTDIQSIAASNNKCVAILLLTEEQSVSDTILRPNDSIDNGLSCDVVLQTTGQSIGGENIETVSSRETTQEQKQRRNAVVEEDCAGSSLASLLMQSRHISDPKPGH